MSKRKTHSPTTSVPVTAEVAFGRVLKQYRIEQGLRQTDLESDSRIDRSYISQLEHGQKQPCLKTIIHLAYKLNLSPGKFIDEVVQTIDKEELRRLLM